MYRGREAPDNAVYDAINGLVNDEGQIIRRGGGAYVTTSDAGANLFSLKSSYYPAPSALRTLAFSTTNHYAVSGTGFVTLAASGISPPYPPPQGSRVAAANKLSIWPIFSNLVPPVPATAAYGGSLKTSVYSTGTVTVTNGSTTVTGVGTSWSANVDAGMIMDVNAVNDGRYYVVKQVNSNTSLTLDETWKGTTTAGASYEASPISTSGLYDAIFQPVASTDAKPYVAYVGRRLLLAYGTRVAFSPLDLPGLQNVDEYHELPGDAFITGIDGVGDTAIVFTTEGVWTISGLFFDAVDAYGNVQQTVSRGNSDVVLWGDAGIAQWAGGFIVPAVDDVFALGPDMSATPISESIRGLYRGYVKAGYQPGMAAVHRGHLLLPIMSGTTQIDLLVCRLDRGLAWTRWAGHSAGPGMATQVGASTRSPKLLAVKAQRVLDLTDTMEPAAANALDADGTTSDLVVITRDYPLGAQQPGFAKNARLRYELVAASSSPTVSLAFTSDQDGGTFSTLTDKGLQSGGTGGAVSDGSKYSWWLLAKRRERLRLRITVTGACASFVLRSVEILLRPSGRQ